MKTVRKIILTLVALALVGSLADAAKPEKKTAKGPPAAPAVPVNGNRDPMPVASNIDRLIMERITAAKVPTSPLADDAEFIRRVSLDIRGRIPAAERVVAFLNDNDPNKRAKLIDEFLSDTEYGEHFAIIWYHRIVKPDDDNRLVLAGNKLQSWLTDRFNKNEGWDKIVGEMLNATGDRDTHPEITFWLANVGDAKSGQPEPNKVTGAASKLFLGVRLECCECHNHPFGTLKQTDFWSTAAFFAQTHADHSAKKAAKNGETPSVHEGGAAHMKKGDAEHKPAPFGLIEIPYSKGKMAKATFLGSEAPANVAGQPALRPVFSAWLTSAKNPFFARALVNKMWANFFGHGITEPVDDMRPEAKTSHPEVLSLLADEFTASKFDLKHMIRCICNSQAYQRTSKPLPENKDDDALYSHMPLKVMSADMLYDSMATALGHSLGTKDDGGKAKGQQKKYGGGPREQFRKFFHAEADDDVGVIEDYTHGIPQVLRLMNSRQVFDTSAAVAKCMNGGADVNKVVENLYLTALSRRPTAPEVERAKKYLATEKDAAKGYGDLLWAMLNTGEFLFNH